MRINPLLKSSPYGGRLTTLSQTPPMYIWRLYESESRIKIAPSICHCSSNHSYYRNRPCSTFLPIYFPLFSRYTSHSLPFGNIKSDNQLSKKKKKKTDSSKCKCASLHIYARRSHVDSNAFFFHFGRKILLKKFLKSFPIKLFI